jgi:hypothetical protein
MNEYQKYINKVLWYVSAEYGLLHISVEEFENLENSNLWMDLVFNCFSANKSFQDCAGSLIHFYKQRSGIPADDFFNPSMNVDVENEEANDAESN